MTTTRADTTRAVHAILAWHDHDQATLNTTLDEAMADPGETRGFVYALLDLSLFLGKKADDDIATFLRAFAADQEEFA